MSLPLTTPDWWESGTNQNSVPANNNALRFMISTRDGVADDVTAQPTLTTPADDGDWYIIPAAATGAQWATFDQDSVAIFFGGAWYEFTPVEGDKISVDGTFLIYTSGAWTPITIPAAATWGAITGTLADQTDLQDALDALAVRQVNIALSDMSTDLTTGTGKAAWFAPEGGTLSAVFIGVHDPSSSGVVRVDMNDAGGTVFTTRPAIDATEATSLTGTAAVLDGTVTFSKGDKFTFDIDDAGTDAKGLQAVVEYIPA